MRLTLLAALLIAAPASAQSINFQMNVPSDDEAPQIDARVGALPGQGQVQMHVSAAATISTGAYDLRYQSSADGSTALQVLSPNGARCDVWQDARSKGSFTVPFSTPLRPGRFYRFVVTFADGSVFDQSLEARSGMLGQLWIKGPTAGPVAVAPSYAPVPAGPMGMGPADFASLKRAVKAESFGDQQVDLIGTAAQSSWFTVAQVGELVDLLSFSDAKVRVVELTARKLLDRQNAFQLLGHFTFSSDKDRVKEILAQ
jgi:hypothetical protein